MEEILVRLKERWPSEPWDIKKLLAHYKNLRVKHRTFLSIAYQSGATFDDESGFVSASDVQWEAFDKKHRESGAWLKTVGLPRPGLYSIVFSGNREGGAAAVEAGDLAGIASIDLTRDPVEEREEEGLTDDENDGPPESQLNTPSAVSTPVRTLGNSRKRAAASEALETPSARARRARRSATSQSEANGNGGTITGSLGLLAASISSYTATMKEVSSQQARGVGVRDLEDAIDDAKELFPLSGAQLVRFMRGLAQLPSGPVLWKSCKEDIEAKKALLYDILGEEIEAIRN